MGSLKIAFSGSLIRIHSPFLPGAINEVWSSFKPAIKIFPFVQFPTFMVMVAGPPKIYEFRMLDSQCT